MPSSTPDTAIVVGAGCSYSLDVPTMANFMDKVFDELGKGEKDSQEQKDLDCIRNFLQSIKSSAAYVRNQVLNIEELYGLADMAEDLGGDLGRKAKSALNRAIFKISSAAGSEFIDQNTCKQFQYKNEELQIVKRESQTEDAETYWPQGTKFTNLLAYLCLAHHKDQSGKYPLFIQFNWDLALDRALNLIWGGKAPFSRYLLQDDPKNHRKRPIIARPHGGINWIDWDTEKIKDEITLNLLKSMDYQCIGATEITSPCTILAADFLHQPMKDTVKCYGGSQIKIVPPTWRKQADSPAFKLQWKYIKAALASVRRIIFIGYSLPKTDLSFRYFLSLALGQNDYCPKVYVWNPDIFKKDSEVNSNYLSLFEPLAREGRLFGIKHYFGDPACFDLERALSLGKPLKPMPNL